MLSCNLYYEWKALLYISNNKELSHGVQNLDGRDKFQTVEKTLTSQKKANLDTVVEEIHQNAEDEDKIFYLSKEIMT